jgi:Cys-tRNA(Pro) deacylase
MHPTAQKFAMLAQEFGLDIAVQEYADGARTAEEAAAAVGCGVAQIVKSLLFVVQDQPTMVLVSGGNRLDEKKLAALCGVGRKQIRRSNADSAREVTGYAIGGIPPFGHVTPLLTYVDADLLLYEVLWAAAGTPHAVFAVTPHDLVRVTNGTVADVKVEA